MKNDRYELTSQQTNAVMETEGKVCLRAGAGTGKTSVLVHRYLKILERGLASGRKLEEMLNGILAVTFTRKAAMEMRDRIEKELSGLFPDKDNISSFMNISTIDSFCAKILKEKSVILGIDPGFTVLEEIEGKLFFLRKCRTVLDRERLPDITVDKSMEGFLGDIYDFIGKMKSMGIFPDQFQRQLERKDLPQEDRGLSVLIHRLYYVYEDSLKSENLFDFNRLLIEVYRLWEEHEDIKKEFQAKFKYVLIDEYQDTSPLQDRLLKMIAEEHGNYFVVGDVKQSIYAFRGGDPSNILEYENEVGDRLFSLTENFRSNKGILALVNKVFGGILPGYEPLHSDKTSDGCPCSIFLAEDQEQESRFIACKIIELMNQGYKPREIVILLRGVKRKALYYEEILREHGIRSVTIGGSGFYDRPEVRDIFFFLKLVDNPFDDMALVRTLRCPLYRIKDSSLSMLASIRKDEDLSEEQIFSHHRIPLYDALTRLSGMKLDPDQKRSIFRMKEFAGRMICRKKYISLSDLVEEVVEGSGYIFYLETLDEDISQRSIANVKKLVQLAREFEAKRIFSRLREFIDYLDEVIKEEVIEKEASIDELTDVVRLMTIHQAKGLEFPVVFVSNITSSNFPSPNRQPAYHYDQQHGFIVKNDDKDSLYCKYLKDSLKGDHLAEENRLLYVAMTRARDRLFLTGIKRINKKMSSFMEYFLEERTGKVEVKDGIRDLIELDVMLSGPRVYKNAECKIGRFDMDNIDIRKIQRRLVFSYKSDTAEEGLELTVSQLATFMECPLRYYYRYVIAIPGLPGEKISYVADDGFEKRLFGEIIHKTLEEYFNAKRKGFSWGQDVLGIKYREICINSGVGQKELKESYIPFGMKSLNNIMGSSYDRAGDDILRVEQPFVLFQGKDKIKGTIDRIDRTSSGIELIDYKTSVEISEERYSFQMNIYRVASGRILGLDPGHLTLLGVMKGLTVCPVDIDTDAEKKMDLARKKIREKDFAGKYGPFCGYCEYALICKKEKPDER